MVAGLQTLELATEPAGHSELPLVAAVHAWKIARFLEDGCAGRTRASDNHVGLKRPEFVGGS